MLISVLSSFTLQTFLNTLVHSTVKSIEALPNLILFITHSRSWCKFLVTVKLVPKLQNEVFLSSHYLQMVYGVAYKHW